MFQVFEHQRLTLNDDFKQHHLNALLRFNDQNGNKYFTAIHRGVKFKHYVGVLQVGDLTIEILPKADKNEQGNTEVWRKALLQMLHFCKIIKIESLSKAPLTLSKHSLLDIYIHVFLSEVEQLLHRGLIKQYQTINKQNNSLKGQIQFQKHIVRNLIHKERFFTQSSVYQSNHILHQVIVKALKTLLTTSNNPSIQNKCRSLLIAFPEVDDFKISSNALNKITLSQKTAHYQTAIDLSKLILLNYCPDLKSGSFDILAILFDMNKLFEHYIYHSFKRIARNEKISITGQPSERFWQKKTIRPDIFIETENEKFVIDTKWKVLRNNKPHDDDLKQMYVYGHYFEAAKGLLVYPKSVFQEEHFIQGDFSKKMFDNSTQTMTSQSCDLLFVDVLKNGVLNKDLGKDILNQLRN